ncbi:MAG: hypothetical protein AAGG53_06705 [Cyanobacteria bacterium P01_H01_bin.152]
MEKIKGQAGKVGELIFAAETGATYQKTITLTWAILRETGILLWLVICLIFVGGEWFGQKSIVLGKSTRTWYEGLKEPSDTEPKSATEMGQSALSAVSTGAETLLYQAKKQLGIEAEPPAPAPPKPTAAAASTRPTATSSPTVPTASEADELDEE